VGTAVPDGRRAQFDGSPASITILEHETHKAKAGHGIIFLLMLGLTLNESTAANGQNPGSTSTSDNRQEERVGPR
jgi:hypothetical protein